MALLISTGLANAMLDGAFNNAGAAVFDGGTARLALFGGTDPATGDAAISNTKLVEWTLPTDAFAVAATKKVIANAISQVTALAAGTITFGVIYLTGGTALTSAAAVTDKRLFMLTEGGRGTLGAALSGGETTVTMVSTASLPSSGSVIIGANTVPYTGKTATTLTGCSNVPAAGNGAIVKQANCDFNVDLLTIAGNENMTAPTLSLTMP